jgi:ribosomal protein S18 acetylase RimI-like enzyme
MFRPDETAVGIELVVEGLRRGKESGYHFVFAENDTRLLGYCCYGPIPCTMGRFDIYWIAVRPSCQRLGLGSALLRAAEDAAGRLGGGRMYIETSSRPSYEGTRAFYLRQGYREEARLKGFYADYDDKVVYARDLCLGCLA